MLKPPKRLVYAYDELQNLSGVSLPPPEEIFGNDEAGRPLVTFGEDRRRDVILQKCYRNSRPVLVSAKDRKSVVEGKSGSVRVDLGGRRIIKKKQKKKKN